MNISQLIKNKKFKSFLEKLYSIGASVVVLGALFKIQHWPGASFMLTTGLLTEAIIFFFYAFDEGEPEHEIPEVVKRTMFGKSPFKTSDAEIQTEDIPENMALSMNNPNGLMNCEGIPDGLFENIGENLRKLSNVTENLSKIDDVSQATLHYVNTLKNADKSLDNLAKSYESTINKSVLKTVFKYQSIEKSLANIEAETRNYDQQMKELNQHLSIINQFYKQQEKGMAEYLKAIEITTATAAVHQEQLHNTNQNLSAMNEVYEGMLGAMNKK